jgi:phenylalanyl-tRNA synthetase beta chain
MRVSLRWIRDYVDLPDDFDPRALAEVFTRTTAEVDGVHRMDVSPRGLIAAQVKTVSPPLGAGHLRAATLDVGGRQVETVTAAPKLAAGDKVIYAPPGASVKATGEIKVSTVAGRTSTGMILSADSVGIEIGGQEAVFLSDEFKPGDPLPAELFDDWLIEIDNKSLTNRPDLWGHDGIAREIAAITSRERNSSAGAEFARRTAPEIENRKSEIENRPSGIGPPIAITIAAAAACPRYSAILSEGVGTQPAPLWMQLRLGHIGQRPISALVDLTNYVMQDIGQPMHAFDGEKVRQIEVDWAAEGERFKTLDGIERVLAKTDLMIKSKGRSVALAGVMGGIETEVTATTKSLLLESANFNGATVRRTASRLGLRTDASARFEKSLDPAKTALGIERFVQLARPIFPAMKIVSRLSDAFPSPPSPLRVRVNPQHAARTIGRAVSLDEAAKRLAPLDFNVTQDGADWQVAVPSFRATGDIAIEADVIEELARCIGYDNVVPAMPHTTARTFAINALHELEQRSLQYFTTAYEFHEIHGYLWYDDEWLARLGFSPPPAPELRNPAGAGLSRLRATLLPNLLAAVDKNRFHFDSLALLELGSVYESTRDRCGHLEHRHIGLALARRGKNVEPGLQDQMRSAIIGWSLDRFARPVSFVEQPPPFDAPWEQAGRTAAVLVDGTLAGRVGAIPLSLRRRIDEHLGAWSVVWAELDLSRLAELPKKTEKLRALPPFPLVEMDFTLAVPRTSRYAEISRQLAGWAHPLLESIRFVAGFEDEKADRRNLTFCCVLASAERTLTETDTAAFRRSFEEATRQAGYEIKKS